MSRATNTEETFWVRVNREGRTVRPELGPCWEWTGKLQPLGYCQIRFKGKLVHVHRLAWQFTFGDPGAAMVCHKCDLRHCCNPSHLFLGSHQDNMDDMVAKSRQAHGNAHSIRIRKVAARGENNGFAKLTEEKVEFIRCLARAGFSGSDIGWLLNINKNNVYHILNGRTWNKTDKARPAAIE